MNDLTDYPLISVIIPTLNRSSMLLDAIKSVEVQTYPNIEIVVVDDCSDEPVVIDMQLFSKSIKVIRNAQRLGGGATRNVGVENASGEYICFLDDDDVYLPFKLDFLYSQFVRDVTLTVAFGYMIVNGDSSAKLLSDARLYKLSSVPLLHTNASLIRKNVFEKIRFLENLKKYQDTQLHMEILLDVEINVKIFKEEVAVWNKNHGFGQITDMQTKSDYFKEYNSFLELEDYISKKYSLSIFNKFFIKKMRIYIIKKANVNGGILDDISFLEKFFVSLCAPYFYFKKIIAKVFKA